MKGMWKFYTREFVLLVLGLFFFFFPFFVLVSRLPSPPFVFAFPPQGLKVKWKLLGQRNIHMDSSDGVQISDNWFQRTSKIGVNGQEYWGIFFISIMNTVHNIYSNNNPNVAHSIAQQILARSSKRKKISTANNL